MRYEFVFMWTSALSLFCLKEKTLRPMRYRGPQPSFLCVHSAPSVMLCVSSHLCLVFFPLVSGIKTRLSLQSIKTTLHWPIFLTSFCPFYLLPCKVRLPEGAAQPSVLPTVNPLLYLPFIPSLASMWLSNSTQEVTGLSEAAEFSGHFPVI